MDKIARLIRIHFSSNLVQYAILVFCCLIFTGILLINKQVIDNVSDIISYFGFVLTGFSIIFAAYGLQISLATQDWNARNLTLSVARETKDNINRPISILQKHFGYLNRSINESITVDEIHKKICLTNDNEELIVDSQNGKLVLNTDDEAVEIRKAILKFLNTFEYLSVGIQQNIFDKEILKSLLNATLIKGYFIFQDYIEHYNLDMYPERQGKLWHNFKELAQELYDERSTVL